MRNRCQIVGTGRGDVRVMEQISLVSFSYQLFRNFETKIRINLRKDSRIYIYISISCILDEFDYNPYVAREIFSTRSYCITSKLFSDATN